MNVAKHRGLSAVIIGTAFALVGWAGASSQAIPLRVVREPGVEIALLLQVAYFPSVRGLLISEWAVLCANMVFWSAAIVLALGIRRAFRRARDARAWLVCAALIATPLVVLSEVLSHYFGGIISDLWWVTYPGWALTKFMPWLPQMSFVMDMRALLGELMYPTRLIHFIVAELLATAVWTLLIWVAILVGRGFTSRQPRPHVRVA